VVDVIGCRQFEIAQIGYSDSGRAPSMSGWCPDKAALASAAEKKIQVAQWTRRNRNHHPATTISAPGKRCGDGQLYAGLYWITIGKL
jgi:hypothetical protein